MKLKDCIFLLQKSLSNFKLTSFNIGYYVLYVEEVHQHQTILGRFESGGLLSQFESEKVQSSNNKSDSELNL